MKNEQVVYIALILVALGTMAGFFFVFDKLSTLSTSVNNMALTLQLNTHDEKATNNAPVPMLSPNQPPIAIPFPGQPPEIVAIPTESNLGTVIPAAILFETRSSTALAPQATTTILVESITKNTNKEITLNIKAFTARASSYTAINPKELFSIVNLDGENTSPTKVEGSFSSMPPKSSTTGRIIFAPAADRNTFILQFGAGDDAKFYEFDFVKKSYKETIIG